METISTIDELRTNIAILDRYSQSNQPLEVDFYTSLVRSGRCFVMYKIDGVNRFAPSRFVGYKNNSMMLHGRNSSKDGRVTTPVISDVLGGQCTFDKEIEKLYHSFCLFLGYAPYMYRRKYWSI